MQKILSFEGFVTTLFDFLMIRADYICIMLFLTHKPTNLLVQNHNKIILTTPHQIIFSTLHFPQEFLSKQLAEKDPVLLSYSESASQAVTVSKEAIEVYWTDWGCKIQMRFYISLTHEPIYSIIWEKQWKIYGNFRQYTLPKVKLTRIQSYDDDFPSCFLGADQYILTNKRLVAYNHHSKKLREIQWGNRDEELSHLKQQNKIEMKASVARFGWTCMNINNLAILVRDEKVQVQLYHQGILYVNEDVLLWIDHGKSMSTYQIAEYSIIKLGQIQTFEGHYLGCSLTENTLAMVFYEFRQLQVKNIRLVDEQENLQYDARKKQKQRYKHAMKTSIKEQLFPEVQDVVVNPSTSPEESKQNININISSNNIQKALKASIQKFQQSFQKSFERSFQRQAQRQAYNQQIDLEAQNQQIDEIRASRKSQILEVPLEQMSKIDMVEGESSGRVEGQGQLIFEWQRMEQNYEQHLESSDVVKELPSHHSAENSPLEYAETPAFKMFENHWENGKNQWNIDNMSAEKENPIVEISQSSKNASDSKSSSIIRHLDNRKYTHILGEIHRKQPQKFDQALQSTMDKVIRQNQARIFFADHFRIRNPSLTRDRLLRLYRHVEDNEQNKIYMGRALSQFRLQEVPLSCLPIKSNILKIFQKIYPTVYVQDLMQPTIRLLEELIQSYFSRKFNGQTIKIEDETIQLVHSRNLLNILLYLNDHYDIPIESVFEIYLKKMIRHDQISTLRKIVQSNVCQICGVSLELFEGVVQNTIKQILQENGTKTEQVEQAMVLLNAKTRKSMTEILSLFGYFQQFQIIIKVEDIFGIPQRKNSQTIIREIIDNCCIQTLSKMSLPFIFQSFGKIEQQKTPLHYESWHIEISKQVAQKFFMAKQFKDGVTVLLPLAPAIKVGFFIKILIKYFNGKFVNRFVCSKQSSTDIISNILRIILSSPFKQLEGDMFPDEDNQQWINFSKKWQQILKISWQMAYILYNDRALSRQLVNQSLITLSQFEECTKQARNQAEKKFSFIDLIPKVSKIVRIPLVFQASSHHSNESAEYNQQLSPNSSQQFKILQRSFRGYDSKSDMINQEISRSVRYNDTSTDPALIVLKLSVQRQSILNGLKQIYQDFPREKFIQALGMVDRQKVELYHIELFKSLCHSHISFQFQKFIPFEYFLDEVFLAWSRVKDQLVAQMNRQNYWTVYLFADITYQKGKEIAEAFIERVIYYEADDQWHQQIQQILQNIHILGYKLEQFIQAARQRNLTKIMKVLEKNIQ